MRCWTQSFHLWSQESSLFLTQVLPKVRGTYFLTVIYLLTNRKVMRASVARLPLFQVMEWLEMRLSDESVAIIMNVIKRVCKDLKITLSLDDCTCGWCKMKSANIVLPRCFFFFRCLFWIPLLIKCNEHIFCPISLFVVYIFLIYTWHVLPV